MNVGPGSLVGGKYRIEQPISRGGMGAVWAARHLELDQPVAIKVMDPALAASPDFRGRFAREARVVARLESPHVVQVKDYGIQEDVPYLVMELLRGEDLARRLRRLRRLDLPQASRIAAQAAKALRRAHEAGLVHRDLKPSNLFLARIDDEEILKILDFGIVKVTAGALPGEMTKTGELLGSPFYMSPEQARGERDLDGRSDLWSLGVILFQAITGALPFQGDNLGVVLSRILVDPIPRATAVAPDLPPAFDEFFARALARNRAERFASAQELALAFAAAGRAADHRSLPPLYDPVPAGLTSIPAPALPGDPRSMAPSWPGGGWPASAGTPVGMAGPAPSAAPMAAAPAGGGPARRGGAARWALGIGALALAAAGTVILVLRGGAGPGASPSAAAPSPAEQAPAAAVEPAKAPATPAPATTPAATLAGPAPTASAAEPAAASAAAPAVAPSAPPAATSAAQPARPPQVGAGSRPAATRSAPPATTPKSGELRDPWGAP